MQQRREEILAKTARLAELKQQRKLRAGQTTASRPSISGVGDVGFPYCTAPRQAKQLTLPLLVEVAYRL